MKSTKKTMRATPKRLSVSASVSVKKELGYGKDFYQ
jgi:hypothetical protein